MATLGILAHFYCKYDLEPFSTKEVRETGTLVCGQILVEMFARMLTVHCDQNDTYEITINVYQVRKINQVLNFVNIPTSALTLRKVSHSRDKKFRF